MATLTYRPFEEGDVEKLAPILGSAWHAYAPSETYRAAAGAYDISQFIKRATFTQVAVVDGEPAGLVFARAGEPDPAFATRWEQRGTVYLERLRELDPSMADATVEFLAAEAAIDERLFQESGCSDAYEVVLLAMGERTRGLGAGKALFTAAVAYLGEQGARNAYLYTDSSCTWQFYEHRGLKRAAEYATTSEENPNVQEEYYLYTLDVAEQLAR